MVTVSLRFWCMAILLTAALAVAACAPAAAPAPTAAPSKPAAAPAAPTTAPAAPAAQPTKPAAPAAQPTAAAAPAAKAPVVELRAGCNNTKEDILCQGVDKLAELIEKKTNGEVKVNVFYSGALGMEQQLTQSVISGSVDIGMVSNGNAARFTDAFLVYDLPFLVSSYDDIFKSLESPTGKGVLAKFEKDVGVKLLYVESYGSGRDVQTTKKQLKVPADIKGLKIRVISSPVDFAIFRAWGANPTPVDWGQTFAALQQGVVDGENIAVASILGAKHNEVLKYALRIDYQAMFELLHMNPKKFASLSPQHQKAITEAAAEASAWDHKVAKEQLEGNMKELPKAGVTPYTPTREEFALWAAPREKVWKEVNEEMKGVIDLDLANKLYAGQ